jgi:hypothetical protein
MALRLKFKARKNCKGVLEIATITPTIYAVPSGFMVAETALAMRDIVAVVSIMSVHIGFSCLQYLSA